MPIIWKVHHGQYNSPKVISLLKEIFSEHRSPETLVSDNNPQYALIAFAEFVDEWKFTHATSLPNHPEGNGFAESMVKIVKQTLQCAKFSGCNIHLALLSYRYTPLDSQIASPTELLYQWCLQSTHPSCLRNTTSDANDSQDALHSCTNKPKTQHDHRAKPEQAPFYAGKDVSVWDT